jgi:hypothetical protein
LSFSKKKFLRTTFDIRIQELYAQSHHGKSSFDTRFDRETTSVRLAHVETVAPLLYKVATKQKEEESRKRREVQFPQSAAEFNTIHDKELQQRIARFLTSDAIIQDKMLNENGWGWRQVQGLKEDYLKDVSSGLIPILQRLSSGYLLFCCSLLSKKTYREGWLSSETHEESLLSHDIVSLLYVWGTGTAVLP